MTVRLLSVVLLAVAGCSEKVAETPAPAGTSSEPEALAKADVPKKVALTESPTPSTNNVVKAEFFPEATPEERRHIQACLDALDDGREALAMRHAREFMDSTNAEVRLQAVESFGWIGKYAIKELAEMMADADEDIRTEALRQWEMAFDEYSNEAVKMQELERAASLLKDQTSLEAVMMKVAGLEDYNAVKVLCSIITSTNSTPVAVEVARTEYASLTDEPFVDERRAKQIVTDLKNADGGDLVPSKENFSTKNKQGKEQK